MIQITVRRDSGGRIRVLRCSGHAAFDMEGGVDIACAGVSALMCAAANGLEQVVGIEGAVSEEGDGLVVIELPKDIDPEKDRSAQVLLETTALALSDIAKYYAGFVEIG